MPDIIETPAPTDADFSGLWIPLVTPFRQGDNTGQVDLPAITALVQQLAADGIKGFVVCGSTGEAAALDKTEQLQVLDATLKAAPGLPVVMGLSGYNLKETSAWVRELGTWPIDGLLVPPPHYVRPSQAGLLHWFITLADASAVPLMVYDIPYRTGVTIERQTLRELAQHPRIQAIKDCGGDAAKTLALIAQGKLQVLAGEDLQMFATMAQGGVGAIAASAHLATTRFVRLVELLRAGQLAEARGLWTSLVPLVEAVFAQPNPGPVKGVLAHQGLVRNVLRAPMTASSSEHVAQMVCLLQALA